MNRRDFLRLSGAGLASAAVSPSLLTAQHSMSHPATAASKVAPSGKADHTLTIEEITLELAKGISIKTMAYNGSVPGPIMRFKHGVPVTVDVINKTPVEEILHWHGFDIGSIPDGAMEEGSPMIAPNGGSVRYSFTPNLTGSRWYHTHAGAEKNLERSTYTGQYGFAYVEPQSEPGAYDREIFLPIHHWGPSIEMLGPPVNGCEVGYKYASFDDKLYSDHEPIRVKKGERVLFRFLNASATQNVSLALPGHTFKVVALDGNVVPNPTAVDTLFIAVAERVDAIVEMNQSGVWMLGSLDDNERKSGLAVKVEYAGATGDAVWKVPAKTPWDYLLFGKSAAPDAPKPDETIMMIFGKKAGGAPDGMDQWFINGRSWPEIDPFKIKEGKRYRISMMNASPELHPMHFHRHSFELASINGKGSSGIIKDTVNLTPFGRAEVDFVANNPGPSLFHCHQQMHMDYGFMSIFQYV